MNRWPSALVVATASLMAAGCGSNARKVEQETSNLKPLMVLYGRYIGQHRGQPPPNEAAFKEFIKSVGTTELPGETKDVDSLFVSTRDKQPYVIIYGPPKATSGPGGQPVVAYEQTGVSGHRLVASMLGAIEDVDEAKFRELVPDAK